MTGMGRKIVGFILSVVFLSGCLFSASYKFFEEITAASTGYNSFENGLFAWRSSYATHEFVDDGESVRGVLVDSGVTIHYSRLAAEIGLWVAVGLSITILIWVVIWRFESSGRIDEGEPQR